jgi:CHAT domain-containing protein
MLLLELTLSPVNDQRFRAIASRVPDGVGDASTECDLPFWVGEKDWRRSIIKILEGSQGFRSENFPEAGERDWLEQERLLPPCEHHFDSAYLQRIGQKLYQSLFPPDSPLKQVLQHSLRLSEQQNCDLHLRLKFAADSSERSRLADYPWELLYDGQRFLLHHRVRLSRYIAYEAAPPQLPAQNHVRVLLISARPQGLAQLTREEQQAIQTGLERAQNAGLVQLQMLPSPTRKALNRYLTDCSSEEMPQVLHFDGHGIFGKRCTNPECLTMHSGIKAESCRACRQQLPNNPQGYLAFETEQGQPDWQSATQVAALLQPHPIALVVLSACQSGMAVAGDSVFNGMAQNLIDQRIPAVVAMQYSVLANAARDFAEQFYRVLGKKEPLLNALNQGIREMDVDGNQWYRPVLYLRWQPVLGWRISGFFEYC